MGASTGSRATDTLVSRVARSGCPTLARVLPYCTSSRATTELAMAKLAHTNATFARVQELNWRVHEPSGDPHVSGRIDRARAPPGPFSLLAAIALAWRFHCCGAACVGCASE